MFLETLLVPWSDSVRPAEIKIIDFGSACAEDQTVYSYIQVRISYILLLSIKVWLLQLPGMNARNFNDRGLLLLFRFSVSDAEPLLPIPRSCPWISVSF